MAIENIKQLFIQCRGDEGKYAALDAIYNSVDVGQTIIFVNTREKAMSLSGRLQQDGHEVAVLVGGKDMPKAAQEAILNRSDFLLNGLCLSDRRLVFAKVLIESLSPPTFLLVVLMWKR